MSLVQEQAIDWMDQYDFLTEPDDELREAVEYEVEEGNIDVTDIPGISNRSAKAIEALRENAVDVIVDYIMHLRYDVLADYDWDAYWKNR